jgi:hypothetical protein
VISVRTRARCSSDRAGDPLDGLVNLFDLGIVLAVAFLLAALQSLNVADALSKRAPADKQPSVVVNRDAKVLPLKAGQKRVPVKSGKCLGQVYELADGQRVYVTKTCR